MKNYMCSVGSSVRRGATQRAVSGNTACGVGQRGVLCEATRRAVLSHAACGEVNQGLYVTQISRITQKGLFVHVLSMTDINNRDGVGIYNIGIVPLIGVRHVETSPTGCRGPTSQQ